MKVLIVCSGNICRSPMAAEYLRHRGATNGLAQLVVGSAGTLGIEGAPASAEAIQVLAEAGLDLTGHRSKGLGEADLRSADYTIVMTHHHLEELASAYPELEGRRWLLRAFEQQARPAGDAPDLEDPMGEPIERYREQFALMRTCLDHMVLYLRHRGRDGRADETGPPLTDRGRR